MFRNAPLRSQVAVPLSYQMTTDKGHIPVPPPPYELLGLIPVAEWDERVRSVLSHLSRNTWSLWMRIYVLVGTIITCGLPWPIIFLVQKAILGNSRAAGDGFGGSIVADDTVVIDQDYAGKIMNARLASGGILLGTFLLVWVPLLGYMAWQQTRLNQLLGSFTTNDSLKGTHQSLRWSITSIKFFTRTASLIITVPDKLRAAGLNSNFHPEAYLPPYIARAEDDRMSIRSVGGGHARQRSRGSWGRQVPEARARFDYQAANMYGAPAPAPVSVPNYGTYGGQGATGRV